MTEKAVLPKAGNDPLEIARAYAAGPGPSGDDFDFFVGEWEAQVVRYGPDGSVLLEHEASWSAQSLFDGRMIEDRFVPRTGDGEIGAVITLRTYCVDTEQWEMVFLWAQQPIPSLVNFVGNRIDDEMILTGDHAGPKGQAIRSRIRFFKITPDSFRWEHAVSIDGSEAWHVHTAMDVQRKQAA